MAAVGAETVSKKAPTGSDKNTQEGRIDDPEKTEPVQDATDEESGTRSPPTSDGLQRWNETTANMFRFFSTLYSFILMGMTDGAVGVRSTPVHDQLLDPC